MLESLKAAWAKLKEQIASLWDKDKGWIVAIVAVGLFVKFRDILIDILINSAKRVKDDADKKDQKLSTEETQLKQQADAAVQDAQNESKKEKPVTDDWYKKGN